MSPPAAGVRWLGVAGVDELNRSACRRIIEAAGRAIEVRGSFIIVLAGGNTPRGVYRSLRRENANWSRWSVYFGDERCLPASHVERNSRMAAREWLDLVPIPPDRVYPIRAELGASAGALAYANTLSGVGEFDLVLLGLGEDGHTASLFPNHDWGTAPDAPDVLAIFDAPKPPPQRVSLSAARLSRAREVLFMVNGESKREAIARWRGGAPLPVASITPKAGVAVLLDRALLESPLPRQ